ncbi:MAG: class I SAM-dependent methyltransferase [Kineosporiaceae bacterium]
MDLDGLSALLTPEGWALLESLPPYEASTAMALGEKLRAEGSPADLVAAALTQSRLRAAARAKFGPFADAMLFTPAGLEQATRLPVAARHAQRFASAGIATVADLGCGIGGDAMAMAGLEREVVAVERDELTAAVATVNLRHWPSATVRCEDATTTSLDGVQGAFCDPARRTAAGRRVLDPRLGSPTLDWVVGLAERVPAVAMKTAPGIGHQLVPDGVEAQWVSVGGDVVEACLWFGVLAREGVRRSALVLPDDAGEVGTPSSAPVEISDAAGVEEASAGPLGTVLYEPDGAVIRSGLVSHVAAAVNGRLVDPTIAYVTADRFLRTPLATAWAVEDSFGFQLKTLRTWLRDRGVGRLTIKKRGTAVEPEQLRRQLRLSGEAEATIVLTRLQGRQSVVVVRPLR